MSAFANGCGYLICMAKKRPDEAVPVTVRPVIDPLDMSLRDLLVALVERSSVANDADWIDIRGGTYPWKRIVAAAERGECEVSRVGRRLMMQRAELTRWLSRHRIGPGPAKKTKTEPDAPEKPKGKYADVVERALRRG